MRKNFWELVNKVIDEADVLLLLLDARLVEETRNIEIEEKVKRKGKPLIYVITKSDLVKKEDLEKYKKILIPCVFVSAKEFLGKTLLRQRILIEAKRAYGDNKKVNVGVLGYPNVGKSSLINAMKGKHSAPTSILSGFTKGIQKIKADNRLMFLDTPGVIPFREKDTIKHTLTGTIDFMKTKDPELVVLELLVRYPGKIEFFYDVETNDDKEEVLNSIALKKKMLKKEAEPDTQRVARMILREWQTGRIR